MERLTCRFFCVSNNQRPEHLFTQKIGGKNASSKGTTKIPRRRGGSTIRTHQPRVHQVSKPLVIQGFVQFLRVVSSDDKANPEKYPPPPPRTQLTSCSNLLPSCFAGGLGGEVSNVCAIFSQFLDGKWRL